MNKNFFFLRLGAKCIYIGPDSMIQIDVDFIDETEEVYPDEI